MSSYKEHEKEIESVYGSLKGIVEGLGVPLEGNCYTYHNTLEVFPELAAKRQNIFRAAQEMSNSAAKEMSSSAAQEVSNSAAKEVSIAELGFNAGHSALLLALGSGGNGCITFYDICSHRYVKPCFEFLKEKFPSATMKLVPGDSRQTLKDAVLRGEKYDLFHLDGGHDYEVYMSDLECALHLTKKGGIIIIDDTNVFHIDQGVDKIIQMGLVEEITYQATFGYTHRIVRVL